MVIYYLILGANTDATDDDIRKNYLSMVRRYTPEKEPEAFKMITIAYDAIKDERSRLKTRLFGTASTAESHDIIRAMTLTMAMTQRRPTLKELVDAERGERCK